MDLITNLISNVIDLLINVDILIVIVIDLLIIRYIKVAGTEIVSMIGIITPRGTGAIPITFDKIV
jgi:hypothetical protein